MIVNDPDWYLKIDLKYAIKSLLPLYGMTCSDNEDGFSIEWEDKNGIKKNVFRPHQQPQSRIRGASETVSRIGMILNALRIKKELE